MNEDFYTKLGEKVKYLREEEGITQQQLADKIGKGLNFVGKIEIAFSKPSLRTLISLADSFGITVSDLTKFD